MPGFNLMSQLFGSKEGHAINTAIDTPIQSLVGKTVGSEATTLAEDAITVVFAKLGVPATPAGILQWADTELLAAVNNSPALTPAEKTLVIDTLNAIAQGVSQL